MTEGYRGGLEAVGGHGIHELQGLKTSALCRIHSRCAYCIVVAIIAMMLAMVMKMEAFSRRGGGFRTKSRGWSYTSVF